MPAAPIGPTIGAVSLSPGAEYGDGFSLYLYVGANPITGTDPFGLSADFDWFAESDDVTSDIIGNRAETADEVFGQLGKAFNTARLIGEMAISMMPGGDAVMLMAKLAKGDKIEWQDLAMAGASMAGGAIVGKIIGKAMKYRALRAAKRLCNCFIAGTLVATPEGLVPIESVAEGDEIMTRSQDDPSARVHAGTVTRVFRNVAPAILWLTLASGEVMGTTPGHEVWTHQDGWTFADQLEVGDTFLGRDGQPVEIVDLHLDRTATPVFNLEVDGTFTYFAEGVWVHNNSACDLLGLLDVEAASRSARASYKNGFSKAGHSLQKHGQRGGPYPKISGGNPRDFNEAAQGIVDDVLTHPQQVLSKNSHGGLNVRAPGPAGQMYGVATDANGNFLHFLEQ